jgi:hypothetical protein
VFTHAGSVPSSSPSGGPSASRVLRPVLRECWTVFGPVLVQARLPVLPSSSPSAAPSSLSPSGGPGSGLSGAPSAGPGPSTGPSAGPSSNPSAAPSCCQPGRVLLRWTQWCSSTGLALALVQLLVPAPGGTRLSSSWTGSVPVLDRALLPVLDPVLLPVPDPVLLPVRSSAQQWLDKCTPVSLPALAWLSPERCQLCFAPRPALRQCRAQCWSWLPQLSPLAELFGVAQLHADRLAQCGPSSSPSGSPNSSSSSSPRMSP